MAEYYNVIKQFDRMCWYYSRDKSQKECPLCHSYPNCNIGQCRKIAFEDHAYFENVVMAWTAEHPEPVYPTWFEWLKQIGVACETILTHEGRRCSVDSAGSLTGKAYEPIPADIAQKLGIEPKGDA